jgi:hypothetical protein
MGAGWRCVKVLFHGTDRHSTALAATFGVAGNLQESFIGPLKLDVSEAAGANPNPTQNKNSSTFVPAIFHYLK